MPILESRMSTKSWWAPTTWSDAAGRSPCSGLDVTVSIPRSSITFHVLPVAKPSTGRMAIMWMTVGCRDFGRSPYLATSLSRTTCRPFFNGRRHGSLAISRSQKLRLARTPRNERATDRKVRKRDEGGEDEYKQEPESVDFDGAGSRRQLGASAIDSASGGQRERRHIGRRCRSAARYCRHGPTAGRGRSARS